MSYKTGSNRIDPPFGKLIIATKQPGVALISGANKQSVGQTAQGVDSVSNFTVVLPNGTYGSTDTSIALVNGQGLLLPLPPFNLIWWDATAYTDPALDPNVEVVRVTLINPTDTLQVVRGQENTLPSAKNAAGDTYKMMLVPTAATIWQVAQRGNTKCYAYVVGGQSFTTGWAKVALNTTFFDNNGIFNPSLSRMTPIYPGFYIAIGNVYFGTAITFYTGIYKNGWLASYGNVTGSATYYSLPAYGTFFCNGTTDYIELWAYSPGAYNLTATANPPWACNYLSIIGPF